MTDTRHALAERDTSKPAEKQGLFDKFKVLRRDGSSEPGEKHDGREYFVLDIDHDPHAKAALAAYADDVEATHPYLAKDMRARYALSAQPVAGAVARDRETDRARFPDPAFNQWLDEGISDAGHTVWDQVGSVIDAWHGWENRKFYHDPQAAPPPEPSAQAVREPGDPLHDDAYVRGVAVGFVEDDSRRTTLLRIADRMQKLAAAPQPAPSAQAVAHPSHQTVREWMPVSEALRLSDLWTAGDLDNCGQWRAAIKVLADEVRALAASPQPEPSAQGEPVACDRDAPVCPWCDRQGLDICQHADDARTCGK